MQSENQPTITFWPFAMKVLVSHALDRIEVNTELNPLLI
jgi:hypothetical protein